MRIILIVALSANGKIAEVEGQTSTDWTSKEDLRFFVEKTKEIGLVIMGRKTFKTIGKPLKGRRLIVLTRENEGQMGSSLLEEGIVEFTHESPHALIDRLQKEGCDRVVVAGGASVYSQFLLSGLVTDLYLTIEPVLFGRGIEFARDFGRMNLSLQDIQRLGDQSVLLHYTVASVVPSGRP